MLRSVSSMPISACVLRNLAPRPQILVPVATFKANKHYNPKFKAFRRLKVIKIDLPDFYSDDKDASKMTPEEVRAKMKEQGLQPRPEWNERSFTFASTSEVFDPYVPPEGDGKLSLITTGGAKQVAVRMGNKTRSWKTIRKIRQYDDDFDEPIFAEQALEIYKELHKTMTQMKDNKPDSMKIRELVTERAYPEVMSNLKLKFVKWQFLESLEPPRVVHARETTMITKDNYFAQVTVRFHTKQVLAVYDRFGRLCHGNPLVAKDVLEYVVFEKNISNMYGTWRIHKKIIPDWVKPESETRRTIRMDDPEPEEELPSVSAASSVPPPLPESKGDPPQLAAA